MKNIRIVDSSRRRFKVQNDLRDWEIDETNKPVKVLNEKYWIREGTSVDPKDIPTEKIPSIDQVPKAEVKP